MLILVSLRSKQAPLVQKILTDWGCLIKTRLGVHDGVLDECTDAGLVFLELVGKQSQHKELARKLSLLEGVQAKLIELSLPTRRTPARKPTPGKSGGRSRA